MRSSILAVAIPLSLVTGCVTDGDEPVTDESEPTVSSTESALCGAYGTPPPANWTHDFGATDVTIIRVISDYGTTPCANYVVKLVLGGPPNHDNGKLTASVPDLPTNAYACVATSLTVRRYGYYEPSVVTTTTNGEWTANGCVLTPRFEGTSWDSPIIEISAQRAMYCPGGPYCATAVYGLPVKLRAEDT